MKRNQEPQSLPKRLWHFIWNDDSIWSWLANIIVAFLLIRFIIYPVLGVLLGTSFPIVAVISESMEHGIHDNVLCGEYREQFHESFDNYWDFCGNWYEAKGISRTEFQRFPFRNGFNKGDVIILWRANDRNLDVGDVLVFQGNRPQPIIHRIVKSYTDEGEQFYQTKGDHNKEMLTGSYGETRIDQERIFGKGILRIPYLGWIKIIFVDAVKPFGINIQR
ncbi:MAG: hypothetical protein Q8R37_05700 [Nanoarchaeota archaeon]|nr:hypothetical protein [Nanoarchaeota archaeon]